MQVEEHKGGLDTAGRAVRIHDMVEDAAEVSLDMFWPDLPMVWKDELVLAKPTTAVYKRAGEIKVLALGVGALHMHTLPS